MSSDVGAILGPLVAGFLADRVGYPVAFAVGAALLLVGTLASVRMPRETPRPAPLRVQVQQEDGDASLGVD